MFRVVSGNSPINNNISIYIYPSGDTTPNVAYNDYVSLAAYATSTTVTNFTGGQEGQVITVRLSSSVTIQNNANIVLKGGVNITGVTSNDYVKLLKRDATTWTEQSRSF
jgi:hypothetical protein